MSNVEMEVKVPLAENSDASPSKVKFISQDEKNGEAKVDIGRSSFDTTRTGLSKEELMKYANDPFWIKVRLVAFILFWIAWVGTLAGSVVIIMLSPKCQDPLNETHNGTLSTTLSTASSMLPTVSEALIGGITTVKP
ncbi:4F2 cell-surface antigen heavy chain-like [Brevipalpus obovatus]|uniref:4F2 cell-surface antigen heavy chain-like n=1 Tax=Brevipalpus obovatus TaxID=246614 RepID=UPI003D9F3A38